MKKIISGKVYDTDKAKFLGDWYNGSISQSNVIVEELYRKRTGEFFLSGRGGANTKYAESRGDDGWTGGSKILPLSWETARQWSEDHLSAEQYEAIFGPVSEDDSRTVITLSLSVGSVDKAKRAAARAGISLSAYIESLI